MLRSLRALPSRATPRRLAVDARLTLATSSSFNSRAMATMEKRAVAPRVGSSGSRPSARPLRFWSLSTAVTSASLLLSLSQSEARCAPWSAAGDDKKKGGDEDKDLLARAQEQLRELAVDAFAAVAALAPGDLSKDIEARANEFLASGKGGQISWGFAMGVCSGFALKKVSKFGAVALGSLFVAMQCASYSGYINVNYQKLERDVMAYLDLNKDGQFDTKDIDSLYQSVMKVLEFSLPAGSGYAVGFLVGFRAG